MCLVYIVLSSLIGFEKSFKPLNVSGNLYKAIRQVSFGEWLFYARFKGDTTFWVDMKVNSLKVDSTSHRIDQDMNVLLQLFRFY